MLKIICCFLVVAIHTVNPSLAIVNRFISISATVAIPVFFTTSGFFVLNKKEISIKWVLKKCSRIFMVCFGWEFLHAIVCFIYYREWRNFISSFFMDFVQQGLFFHFWFFGSLTIMYVLSPFIFNIKNKHIYIYKAIIVALIIINIVIDIVQFILKKQIILNTTQTFRVWTWLMYYMLGGLLYETHFNMNHIKLFCTAYILMVCWMLVGRYYIFGNMNLEAYYGALPVILTVVSEVVIFRNLELEGWLKKIVTIVRNSIMGIYIIHPFILSVIIHFIPQCNNESFYNVIFWIATVVISFCVSYGITRMPLFNYLVKL